MAKYPALSYTAIKLYETCPYRFYQEKILKTVPYEQSEAAALGDRIHKELEAYILKDGQHTLSDEAKPFHAYVEGLRLKPGMKFVETKMAMDWNVKKVDYFKGKDIWIRGQFDFMTVDGGVGKMVDYKTGSDRYPDVGQLELMSTLAFLHFPELKTVEACLLFINKNSLVKASFTRDKMPAYVEKWKNRSIPIVQSIETRDWKATKNALCKWCPIKDCRFHPTMTGDT